MDKNVRTKLEQIKNQIDELLNQEELTFVGTFYGVQGKYELYLLPKSTEKILNWYDAKGYCELLGGDLPTVGELQFIYDSDLSKTFEDHNYWSSIGHNSAKAYNCYFGNGNVVEHGTYTTLCVRAVRRYYI